MQVVRPLALASVAVASLVLAQEALLPPRARGFTETKTLRLSAVWGSYPLDRDEPGFKTTGVAVSPDGRLAVVAAEPFDFSPQQRGLRVYDLAGGELVAVIGTELSPPTSVAFLPHRKRVVSGHKDGRVRVLTLAGEVEQVLEAHKGEARVAAKDGAIVSTGADGLVKEWDEETGAFRRSIFTDAKLATDRLAARGDRVAFTLGDAVCVLDGIELIHTLEAGDEGGFGAIALSADGRRLAVGRTSSFVELHDLETKKRISRTRISGKVGPSTIAFAPDGKHLVAGSGDAGLHVIETERGAVQSVISGGFCRAAAFTPDGGTVIAVGLAVERVDFAKRLTVRERDGHTWRIVSIAAAKDGSRVVTASGDGSLKVWEKGRVARTFRCPGAAPERVALTSDGRLAVASRGPDASVDGEGANGRDDTLAFFDLDRGIAIAPVTTYSGHVEAVAVSAEALVAFSVGSEVIRWDLPAASREILSAEASDPKSRTGPRVTAVAVSPDGARFVAGTPAGTLEMRATKRGGKLGSAPKAHAGEVRSVAFAPDGKSVLSTGSDGTVQLHVPGANPGARWDRKWSVRPVAEGDEGTVDLLDASLSADGERVLVVGRKVELRDARNGALLDAIDIASSGDAPLAAAFMGRDVLVGTQQGVVLRFAPK